MPHTLEKRQAQQQFSKLNEALESGTFIQVRRMLNGLPAADVADFIESSPPHIRLILWELIDKEFEGDVLQELNDELQSQFVQEMDTEQLIEVTEGWEADDLADILQQLPNRVIAEVLQSIDAQDRQRLETVLSFEEDTAGGIMSTDTITVRPRLTLDVVLRYLRRHDELPPMTDNIIVVNRRDEFVGLLPMSKLLTNDPDLTVREVMVTEAEAIPADMSDTEVAHLFEKHNWVSAPVVNEAGKLLGRVTIDDVVDVIIEDADHSFMSMAGLDEDEDTFAPVMKTLPRRAIWLGINLITAFIASAVIKTFEGTIDKVVALAVLMPIVASMGGVAGSQTLTVIIRGLALGQVNRGNTRWLLSREFYVGALNGLFWAFIVALAAAAWYQDTSIGFIIAAAMIINLTTAALAGTILPIFLKSQKIDPALAGSVALTTITDVVGFMSFLGLAAYFYA